MIRDTLPHTQARYQVYHQDSIEAVQRAVQGISCRLLLPLPRHYRHGTPKQGLRQGTEKGAQSSSVQLRNLSFLLGLHSRPSPEAHGW